MLRDHIGFQGILTKYSSKYKSDINDVITEFTIQHQDIHDAQTFLDTYQEKCEVENISCLFREPVQWKSISINADHVFDLDFDGITLDGIRLKEIKVRRKYDKKAMSDSFTYDLVFEQISAQENDRTFSACLKAKEEDPESGKKKLIQYTVSLDNVNESKNQSTED